MAYDHGFIFYKGPSHSVTLADLRWRLKDTSDSWVGSEQSSTFYENGVGFFYCLAASIPDEHQGWIVIYESGASSSPVAEYAINPSEMEIVRELLSEAVPGSFLQGSVGYALGLLGAVTISTISPVSESGDVTTYQGDDYNNSDSRRLEWSDSGASWPDLTSATIAVVVDDQLEVAGVVITPTGATKEVGVELTAANTAAIEKGIHAFQVIATLTSARVVTLVDGDWTSKIGRTARWGRV